MATTNVAKNNRQWEVMVASEGNENGLSSQREEGEGGLN